MTENSGTYDDLYMDLTFVEVFSKEGLDAPIASHINAFANAGYMLWHANQAARYHILHGIIPRYLIKNAKSGTSLFIQTSLS